MRKGDERVPGRKAAHGARSSADKSPAVDVAAWAAPPVSGLARFVAIARWLPQYGGGKWLAADLLAGMTVWGLIVPEAMGYASIAGMPLQAGLYTLVGTLIVYTIFLMKRLARSR
jgi:Sulfate permease family